MGSFPETYDDSDVVGSPHGVSPRGRGYSI